MLKADKISLMQYYDRRLNSFYRNYRKLKLRLSKKIIHQLRVDIKYMRAIYSLLKTMSKESIDESVLQIIVFDRLFQAAGKVREEQVNLSSLKRYKFGASLSLYKKYLVRRKRSAFWRLHKEFHEYYTVATRRKIEEKEGSSQPDFKSENAVHAQNFIKKGIKKIKKLYPDLSEKNLHDIRKELKEVNYVSVYLNEIFPDNKYEKLPGKIKSIELLIGSWHNRTVLQDSIEEFLTRDESFPELIMLNDLIRTIRRENKKAIKLIDKKLGKVFS